MPARLHATLHEFSADAAATLAAAVAAGDEVPFEVVEAGAHGARPGLFHYRLLTANFIERHWDALERLPAAAAAETALDGLDDLGRYLDTYAAQRSATSSVARDALRCFVHRVLDACEGEFTASPERFEPAYRELTDATDAQEAEVVVLALLRGLGCESPQMELAEGTLLVPLARLEVLPPDPLWRRPEGSATVLALMPPLHGAGLDGVADRLRDIQTAMRLYAPGIALSPLAWIRGQRAAWRPVPVPGGGRADARGTLVSAAAEEELRAFAAVVARRRPVDGEAAWALERFELGCGRDDPLTGLTDHMLALRALLEPEGARSGRLAGRVAALCAPAPARVGVTERLAHAISLEQAWIGGIAPRNDAIALCDEVEGHLRALLRDVVCGHLVGDLVELADSLLWTQGGEPEPSGELRVQRTRAAPRPPRVEHLAALDDYGAAEGDASLLDETW